MKSQSLLNINKQKQYPIKRANGPRNCRCGLDQNGQQSYLSHTQLDHLKADWEPWTVCVSVITAWELQHYDFTEADTGHIFDKKKKLQISN